MFQFVFNVKNRRTLNYSIRTPLNIMKSFLVFEVVLLFVCLALKSSEWFRERS